MSTTSISAETAARANEQSVGSSPARGGAYPAGFSAPAIVQRDIDPNIAKLAADIVTDRHSLQLLCDRVCELLLEDIRLQQERRKGYGSRRI